MCAVELPPRSPDLAVQDFLFWYTSKIKKSSGFSLLVYVKNKKKSSGFSLLVYVKNKKKSSGFSLSVYVKNKIWDVP